MPRSKVMGLLAGAVLVAAACGGGSSNSAAKTATNAAALGGMDKLVEAANAEGALNVIALPPEWANYKGVLAAFKAKYPKIKVDRAGAGRQQPAGDRRGQGQRRHRQGARRVRPHGRASPRRTPPMFAPYQVAALGDIPANLKEPTGLWVSDYAGFMSIGCDAKKVAAAGDRRRHAQARVQGHDRAERQPEGRRPASTASSWPRSPTAARPTTSPPGVDVLQRAQHGRQPPAGRPDPGHDRLGPDAVRHRLGVQQRRPDGGPRRPRASTGRSACPSDAPPVAAYYLQAINKDAPASGGRPPVGGVPVHARGPEQWLKGFARPVLPGQDDQGRDDRPGRAGRARQGRAGRRSS